MWWINQILAMYLEDVQGSKLDNIKWNEEGITATFYDEGRVYNLTMKVEVEKR